MFDIQEETVYLLILIPGVQNAWMAGGCFRPGSKKFMGSQESPDGRLSAASQCCLLVQVIRKCTRSSFAYLPGINSCFRSSTAFMAHSAMREVPARPFGFFARGWNLSAPVRKTSLFVCSFPSGVWLRLVVDSRTICPLLLQV